MTLKTNLLMLSALSLLGMQAQADEGQWQPHQLTELQGPLTALGISLPAKQLADLESYPLNAMVSLGYCSASFVSPQGLVVTNHHCGYGAIQQNSSAKRNLIADGFLAKSLSEELPAGPQERFYVTELVEDVSAKVRQGTDASQTPADLFDAIEQNRKQLIASCESDANYRCSVVSFHHGLQFFLIKQLMIQDVRLVYAPSASVGNFGGDTDNYEYPRHTGDYTFLRAYVGKDGKPAPFSKDNVPYQPRSFLKVNASGVKAGDGILLAGYPGQTSRYRLAEEIRFAADWQYPQGIRNFRQMIDTIEDFSKKDPALQVRYAAVVKGYHNRMKKMQGLQAGFVAADIPALKQQQQAELQHWLQADPARQSMAKALAELQQVVRKEQQFQQQTWYFDNAKRGDLFKAALELYKLAEQSSKPDAQRDAGYQARDLSMWQGRLNRLDTSFAPEVDVVLWSQQLEQYLAQPVANRVKELDAALQLVPGMTAAQIAAKLQPWYQQSSLMTAAGRLAWLGKTPADFAKSSDPFIRAAVAVYPAAAALEAQQKTITGLLLQKRPAYMSAVIAFNQTKGKPVYPDANGTLRVTYGQVDGYPASDGVYKTPFTSVRGMIAKRQPDGEFALPEKLVTAYQQKRYDGYFHQSLGGQPALPFASVPLNFLSSADTTGGNSGSAVMNGRGELVGLNFDSTFESISKDWYFNPPVTRAIHVDIRFVLWMMQEVDGADNLLKEMTIVK